MVRSLLVLALALVGVNAECPNACSGHGDCTSYDTCFCWRNFEGADCSLRTCPFGYAHVDTPKGDLDGSSGSLSSPATTVIRGSTVYPYGTQEQFPNMTDSLGNELENTAHYYMECSNKGICDRKAGECECFPGYDGSSCQRASCPNDCSGHGTCEHISTLAANDYDNVYSLWDADKTMGCACDAGYSGPDCSTYDCKYGIDPLYVDDASTARVNEVTYRVAAKDSLSGTYALKFYDVFGEDYVTEPIDSAGTCDTVTDALEALPDTVIPQLSIVCTSTLVTDTSSEYSLTFTGNPGYLKQIEIDAYLDGDRATLTGTAPFSTYIFNTGRTGEFTDYFANQCQGVVAKITGTRASTTESYTGTIANELNSGYALAGMTAAEIKALKICLGDADGVTSNNIEVYNWDYGSMYALDGSVSVMDSYPHAIKLVKTEPNDNFEGGLYYLMWWAPDDDTFVLANAPAEVGGNYDETTTYHVYTTDGVVERVILDTNLDGELTEVTDADYIEARVTAYFAQFDNVLYTSYDTSCETGHTYIEPCLEKGDLLFIIQAAYLKGDYDVTNSADDSTSLVPAINAYYDSGNLYTIEKIYVADPTDGTFSDHEDRYRIVLDKNIPFAGTNMTNNFALGSANTSRVGVVNLFKFTPATTGNYEFVSQCSNRGACDTDAGNCECFKGYTNDDCATQSSLAM